MRNKKLFCGNKSTKVLLHTTDGWIEGEGEREREREGGDLIDCEEEMGCQLLIRKVKTHLNIFEDYQNSFVGS